MPREPRRDRMRKVWVVIRREFVERIRRRWFWVMALLGPLFFAAVFVLPTVLASRGGVRQIVVVDATTGPVGARITHLLNDSPMFRARRVPASGKVVDSLTTEVEQKRLAGFLIVTDAAADSGKAEYRGSNVSGFATVGALERTIGDVVSAVRLVREGVDSPVSHLGRLREAPVRPPAGILDGWRCGRGGSDLPGPSRQRRHRGCVHHLLPRRVLPVLRDVRGGGRHIVERAGGPTDAAADLLAARAVVREHVRHAERSRVRLCGHAVARPVQLPDRDAGALGRRKPADLRVGAVARNPRRVDCCGHVDRGAHIRSEEHTSELQSLAYLVCRLLLEKKKKETDTIHQLTFASHYARSTSWSAPD